MDKLVWDDGLSVGDREIDADHQQLAALINLLVEHGHLPSDAPAVGDILNALGSYTAYHFQREEAYLIQTDRAGLQPHLKSHRHFQSILHQIIFGAASGRVHLGRVVGFLVPWWSSHILDQDMEVCQKPSLARLGS